jgi:hypothetical protein
MGGPIEACSQSAFGTRGGKSGPVAPRSPRPLRGRLEGGCFTAAACAGDPRPRPSSWLRGAGRADRRRPKPAAWPGAMAGSAARRLAPPPDSRTPATNTTARAGGSPYRRPCRRPRVPRRACPSQRCAHRRTRRRRTAAGPRRTGGAGLALHLPLATPPEEGGYWGRTGGRHLCNFPVAHPQETAWIVTLHGAGAPMRESSVVW